jgi:type II secretory pathway component GspD/PulD (secretin)
MPRQTLAAIAWATLVAATSATAAQEMPVVRLSAPPGADRGQTPAQQPVGPPRPAPQTSAPLPPLPATQVDATAASAALDVRRQLSLTFVEPRPIDEVLRLLLSDTPFSLAIDADVSGAFRGELRDLTLREALTTLLTPLGLDDIVEGTVLRITRRRADTRQFDLNVLDVRRGLQRTTGSPAASVEASAGRSAATLTTTVPADDVFGAIGEGVQALLSDSGRVHIDRRAGLATVTDFPERLDRVALYLETLQTRSSREVRLQAQALEVTLRPGSSSIDWQAVRQSLGVRADAPIAGLVSDLTALCTALAKQGDIRQLWSPEVTTINNEPALLRIDTPGLSSLTLTVVPQISSDGVIQLAVTHTWEDRGGERKEGFMKSTPVQRISEADTVTRLTSGRAVLLAGLPRPVEIAKQATGEAAPFGAQTMQNGYAELVVVLWPTIVTTGTRD